VLDLKGLAGALGEQAALPAVRHELRRPLTAIRGYLETLLEEEADPETTRRFLETARNEALRLSRLIDGMLDLPMLELQQPVRRALACDIVEQIRATIEIVSPMARKRDVTIRTRAPKRAVAVIDSDECVHALSNLVENAIKHGSEHGTVEVRCRRIVPFVEVAVEDDGNGVDPADRAAIFELGSRGACTDRTGSGIGLAVVKAIAQRARGEVCVDSSTLGGARFLLRLPAK
jgi:two-component system, OmpR family, phosphate regulon sensor histidine kinase PhoR